MHFVETALAGAWIVDLEPREDDRGFFARAFCGDEFEAHGIVADVKQANISSSHTAGTMRGLHFQYPPAAENKFVRCIAGAIYDVVVDLRAGSPTFLQHVGVELSAANHTALVVPPGFAHGFMTLEDMTEVMYLVSERYTPAEEGGLRHDDPALDISWPRPATIVSDKDRGWPDVGAQRAAIEARMG
jgi:dTDP-4-dehydrorhamnose 3,5-epimerase